MSEASKAKKRHYLQGIRLLKLAKPYLFLLVIGFICMFFEVYLNIAIATVQELFIGAMEEGNLQTLIRLIRLTSVFAIVLMLLIFAGYLARQMATFFMARDFSLSFLEKVSFIPYQKAEKFHSGDLLTRLNRDVNQASYIISFQSLALISNLLTALVAFFYMGTVDWKVSLLVFSSGPIIFLLTRFFDKHIYNITKTINDKSSVIRAHIQETLQNTMLIKAYNLQKTVVLKFDKIRQDILSLHIKRAVLHGMHGMFTELLTQSIMLVASTAICLLAVDGVLSVGVLMSFVLLIGRVQWPFVGLSKTWGAMQEGFAASERVYEIIDEQDEKLKSERSIAVNLPAKGFTKNEPLLEITNLTFAHQNSKLLFNNLNFKLYPGETVAVVGPSGSGKTTLAKLCLCLYVPTAGTINFLGRDITENGPVLRDHIAYVPQLTYLFSGTVKENIALGRKDASEAEIKAAAQAANATEFIEKLPEGFNTNIGEQGSQLSGGQRQRLALARAFLKDAPFVILDEATSALDNESERLVKNAITTLTVNRTALIIAHRLTTIKNADRILVLDNGHITEEGTHEKLLAQNGLYAKLYMAQETE